MFNGYSNTVREQTIFSSAKAEHVNMIRLLQMIINT